MSSMRVVQNVLTRLRRVTGQVYYKFLSLQCFAGFGQCLAKAYEAELNQEK